MKYVLGLDIGITSVGWAVLDLDASRIEHLGVRAFNAAEDPKTQAPLALPRREARCARRRLRRRAGRLRRAKDLFVSSGLIAAGEVDTVFETRGVKTSPWQLRSEGLDRILTAEELARALFHVVKRRGFKSNRKNVKDSDDGDMLTGISANRQIMAECGYRTAGEMLWKHEKFAERKRNGHGSYEKTLDRCLLEEEIRTLLSRQRELGNTYATQDLERDLLGIYNWQKPFASGDDIVKLVGKCTLTGELRAPRHAYSAERAHLLQKLNSLSYTMNGDRRRLDQHERAALAEMAYSHSKVTFAQARKVLKLPEDARFVGLTYMRRPPKDAPMEESIDCEKTTLIELRGYHTLRKAFDGNGLWARVSVDHGLMDSLAFALTFYKTDADIRNYLADCGADLPVIEAALSCEGFTKSANLSITALRSLIPHLEAGLVYSEACTAAGYDHTAQPRSEKRDLLPPIPDDINNPVVRRALSQARKVTNAVIRRYGAPYRIHVEMARDVGRSPEDRKKIKRTQDENLQERLRLEEQFRSEFGREPNGGDLLKWRLYREQNGQCAYCQHPIDASRLFEPGYAEIDHILPYSRSFDDGRANRVLVLASQNQLKRNRTPSEFFGHDAARWSRFEGWVHATIRDYRKKNNLLRKELDQRTEQEWKDRNLTDTRYATRMFAGHLRRYLTFSEAQSGNGVVCVNGQITAKARGLWGLNKDRNEGDLHHALDAAVVATLLPHMIEEMTRHAKIRRVGGQCIDLETGEILGDDADAYRLRQPWQGFRKELMARLSDDPASAIAGLGLDSYAGFEDIRPVLVSRMPMRKVSGAIHEDTIRSVKALVSVGVSVVRKPLTSLTANDLDRLFAPETNQKLYAAIRARMAEHGNNAQKAFAAPLLKPTNDGSPGSVVKRVKVCQTQNAGVPVRGGIADNKSIVRTDVFRKLGKTGKWEYYIVPVYMADALSGLLPNRAVLAHKPYDLWPVMDDSCEFLYSLYPYDMVRVETGSKSCLFYYTGPHRANGSLEGCLINNSRASIAIGVKTALSVEKFEMGVLGDYHQVRKEKRRGLENGSCLKPCEVKD